jgi:hypothetical protein
MKKVLIILLEKYLIKNKEPATAPRVTGVHPVDQRSWYPNVIHAGGLSSERYPKLLHQFTLNT